MGTILELFDGVMAGRRRRARLWCDPGYGHMDEELNRILVYGGLVLGFLSGATLQRTRFCLVAAVSNLVLLRDYRHLHAYLAAAAVAVAGTLALESASWINGENCSEHGSGHAPFAVP